MSSRSLLLLTPQACHCLRGQFRSARHDAALENHVGREKYRQRRRSSDPLGRTVFVSANQFCPSFGSKLTQKLLQERRDPWPSLLDLPPPVGQRPVCSSDPCSGGKTPPQGARSSSDRGSCPRCRRTALLRLRREDYDRGN